jgi:hypothetical protein
MDYDKDYKKRSSAKKHFTKAYSQEELENIKSLIQAYYNKEFPGIFLNTNEANYSDLADEINVSRFNGKEVIKAKYLCEIYNGTNASKKKSIEKMTNIKEFLQRWFGSQQKQNKEQMSEGENVTLSDWKGVANTTTPQWADYVAVPLKNGMLKRLTCDISTKSKYYRIGFKLLRIDGKLFGDGSIQSQDNNFVIHIGKNYTDKDLFITTYKNGILERPDKYPNIFPRNNCYTCELNIDAEGFLHFFINNTEVYKNLVNKEILSRAYLLAWGDGNKFEVKVNNIKIETERT